MKEENDEQVIDYSKQAPVRSFVSSLTFEIGMLVVIILNCILLTQTDPSVALQSPLIETFSYTFSVIFIFEMILKIAVTSVSHYFSDAWNVLDFLIVLDSLYTIILHILMAVNAVNPRDGIFYLAAFRSVKAIRVIRALKLVHSTKFVTQLKSRAWMRFASYVMSISALMDAIQNSIPDVFITILMLSAFLLFFAMVGRVGFGDNLEFRCVQDSLTGNLTALSTYYFKTYDVKAFHYLMNRDFCGEGRACDAGFTCTNIGPITQDSQYFGFHSIKQGFITNFIAITLRGWVDIFWLQSDSTGYEISMVYLIFMVGVATLIMINLFPAIMLKHVAATTRERDTLKWRLKYKGDDSSLSEFDLMLWAYDSGQAFTNDAGESFLHTATAQLRKEQDVGRCMPQCRPCSKLRKIFVRATGPFSNFVIFVVFSQILVLSSQAATMSDEQADAIDSFNLFCLSVYILEVGVKIVLLGPYMYFASSSNILDFFLTAIAVVTDLIANSMALSNLRVIRIVRLLRLFRLLSAVRQLQRRNIYELGRTFDLFKFADILQKLAFPFLHFFILFNLFLFIFSIVGMQTFGGSRLPDTIKLEKDFVVSQSYDTQGRLNMRFFTKAFVTLFTAYSLDAWYVIMWNQVSENAGVMITSVFFYAWIFVSIWFLQSVLLASIIKVMEKEALNLLIYSGSRYEGCTERIMDLKKKVILRHYFKIFKDNYFQETEVDFQLRLVKRVGNDFEEMKIVKESLRQRFLRFIRETRRNPLIFIPENSALRAYAKALLSDPLYLFIVLCAVVISVIYPIIDALKYPLPLDDYQYHVFAGFLLVIFLTDMFAKIIAYGLFYRIVDGDGYFLSIFNWVDFTCNIFLFYSVVTGDLDYGMPFAVIRLFRLPTVPLNFIRSLKRKRTKSRFSIINLLKLRTLAQILEPSRSTVSLLEAIGDCLGSLLYLIAAYLVVIFIFGFIGLQIWSGTLGRCSDDTYPAGHGWKDPAPGFPNGCTGNISYGHINATLEWITPIDNYDNIWKSMQSVFRVVMVNEWHSIMFHTMDASDGPFEQPIYNKNPAAFLFYYVIVILASALGYLFVAVLYYHYSLATLLLNSRKTIYGVREAIWLIYEPTLARISFNTVNDVPSKYKASLIYRTLHSIIYKIIWVLIVVVPFVMIEFQRSLHIRDMGYVLLVDCVLTAFYLADYISRKIIDRGSSYRRFTKTKVDTLEVAFLIMQVISSGYIWYTSFDTNIDNLVDFALANCCLRLHRLGVFFDRYRSIMETLLACIFSFIPLMLGGFAIVVIYGVLGPQITTSVYPDSGYSFYDDHYNFSSLLNTILLLLNVATSNGWTGYIYRFSRNADYLGQKFIFYLYFLTFFILFDIVRKSFAILIMHKFQSRSNEVIFHSSDLIEKFREAWRKVNKSVVRTGDHIMIVKSRKNISLERLPKLLMRLPQPFGMLRPRLEKDEEGSSDYADEKGFMNQHSFLDISRFTKQVMLNIPSNEVSLETDWGRKNYFRDLDDINDVFTQYEEDKKLGKRLRIKFTFNQILKAVHKNVILGYTLPDAVVINEGREQPQLWLMMLRLRFMTYLQSKYTPTPDSTVYILQRLGVKYYRQAYVDLMSRHIDSMAQRIHSVGLTGFEAFLLSAFRRSVIQERVAAEKQKQFARTVNDQTIGNNTEALQKFHQAYEHLWKVESLERKINNIYNENVTTLWSRTSLAVDSAFVETGDSVSAVSIDSQSTLFVGFTSGNLKIFQHHKTDISKGKGLSSKGTFTYLQKLKFDYIIRSICVLADGTRALIACGKTIIIIGVDLAQRARDIKGQVVYRVMFTQPARSSNAFCVCFHQRLCISGYADGYVALWTIGQKVLRSSNVGSAVICVCTFKSRNEKIYGRDMPANDVLACGTESGHIHLFSIDNATEILKWKYITVSTDNGPISSICAAWTFLYTGFANGSMKVWSIQVQDSTSSRRYQDIDSISLVCVSTEVVHTGPVTGLCNTGGLIFSCAHDMGLITWSAPTNLRAKSSIDFKHMFSTGLVNHSQPIISMACNSSLLITGDEEGKVVVLTPKKMKESMDVRNSNDEYSEPVEFSFLEYDFGFCYLPLLPSVLYEETDLICRNTTTKPISIRCLLKKSNHVTVKLPPTITDPQGLIMIPPDATTKFRIIFTPTEPKQYRIRIPFYVDEISAVSVFITGIATKPRLELRHSLETARADGDFNDYDDDNYDNPQVGEMLNDVDFYEVTIGKSAEFMHRLFNPTRAVMVVQYLGDISYTKAVVSSGANTQPISNEKSEEKDSSAIQTTEITDMLPYHGVTVFPKCFVIDPGRAVWISITYSPKPLAKDQRASFSSPVIFHFCGGQRTVFTVKGHAEQDHARSRDGGEEQLAVISGFPRSRDARKLSQLPLALHCEKVNIKSAEVASCLLRLTGWRVGHFEATGLAYHERSGVFLKFRQLSRKRVIPEEPILMVNFHFDPNRTNKTSKVDAIYYELRSEEKLLSSGEAIAGFMKIVVKASELSSSRDPRKAELPTGLRKLRLNLYRNIDLKEVNTINDEDKLSRLVCEAIISISQGFDLEYNPTISEEVRLHPCLYVQGIEKVVRKLEDGLGTIEESFGTGNSDISSSFLSDVKLTLSPIRGNISYLVHDDVLINSKAKRGREYQAIFPSANDVNLLVGTPQFDDYDIAAFESLYRRDSFMNTNSVKFDSDKGSSFTDSSELIELKRIITVQSSDLNDFVTSKKLQSDSISKARSGRLSNTILENDGNGDEGKQEDLVKSLPRSPRMKASFFNGDKNKYDHHIKEKIELLVISDAIERIRYLRRTDQESIVDLFQDERKELISKLLPHKVENSTLTISAFAQNSKTQSMNKKRNEISDLQILVDKMMTTHHEDTLEMEAGLSDLGWEKYIDYGQLKLVFIPQHHQSKKSSQCEEIIVKKTAIIEFNTLGAELSSPCGRQFSISESIVRESTPSDRGSPSPYGPPKIQYILNSDIISNRFPFEYREAIRYREPIPTFLLETWSSLCRRELIKSVTEGLLRLAKRGHKKGTPHDVFQWLRNMKDEVDREKSLIKRQQSSTSTSTASSFFSVLSFTSSRSAPIESPEKLALQKILKKNREAGCGSFLNLFDADTEASPYSYRSDRLLEESDDDDDDKRFNSSGLAAEGINNLKALDDLSGSPTNKPTGTERLDTSILTLVLRTISLPGLHRVLTDTQVKEVLGTMNTITSITEEEFCFWLRRHQRLVNQDTMDPVTLFSKILEENLIEAHRDAGVDNVEIPRFFYEEEAIFEGSEGDKGETARGRPRSRSNSASSAMGSSEDPRSHAVRRGSLDGSGTGKGESKQRRGSSAELQTSGVSDRPAQLMRGESLVSESGKRPSTERRNSVERRGSLEHVNNPWTLKGPKSNMGLKRLPSRAGSLRTYGSGARRFSAESGTSYTSITSEDERFRRLLKGSQSVSRTMGSNRNSFRNQKLPLEVPLDNPEFENDSDSDSDGGILSGKIFDELRSPQKQSRSKFLAGDDDDSQVESSQEYAVGSFFKNIGKSVRFGLSIASHDKQDTSSEGRNGNSNMGPAGNQKFFGVLRPSFRELTIHKLELDSNDGVDSSRNRSRK